MIRPDPRAVCAGWQPIYPAAQDVLTDITAREIVAHDEKGVEHGCWKSPTPQR